MVLCFHGSRERLEGVLAQQLYTQQPKLIILLDLCVFTQNNSGEEILEIIP